MTLLGSETGNRLDYRGFQRRAAPADRSAYFCDTTGSSLPYTASDRLKLTIPAKVYDVFFGPTLLRGRLLAHQRMGVAPGDRVLEVGVGTAINAALYPRTCHVTGIDFSTSMLEKARRRINRKGLPHVRLMEMDAAALTFADESFDIVYAPHVVSCVSDPLKVVSEMRRVCKPGGKIVILNHFLAVNPILRRLEREINPFTVRIGFRSDMDLRQFLIRTDLVPVSIEKVPTLPFCSVVTCIKADSFEQTLNRP